MLRMMLAVTLLIGGIVSQVQGHTQETSRDCRGDLVTSAAASAASASQPTTDNGQHLGAVSSVSKRHGIKLSWDASVPANDAPANALKGYNIYRRSEGKRYEQINTSLIEGTSCVDYLVIPGVTYYYEARAVSMTGAASGPSREAKAAMPPQ